MISIRVLSLSLCRPIQATGLQTMPSLMFCRTRCLSIFAMIVHIAHIGLDRTPQKVFKSWTTGSNLQTNSDLEITSAISVPNVVKIREKMRPLSLTKERKLRYIYIGSRTPRMHTEYFRTSYKRYSQWEIYLRTHVPNLM